MPIQRGSQSLRQNWKKISRKSSDTHVVNFEGMKYWYDQVASGRISNGTGGLDIAFLGDELITGCQFAGVANVIREDETGDAAHTRVPLFHYSFTHSFRRKVQAYYNPSDVLGGLGFNQLTMAATVDGADGLTSTGISPRTDSAQNKGYLTGTAPHTLLGRVDIACGPGSSLPYASAMEFIYSDYLYLGEVIILFKTGGGIGMFSATASAQPTSGYRAGLSNQESGNALDEWNLNTVGADTVFTADRVTEIPLRAEGFVHYSGDKLRGVRTWAIGHPYQRLEQMLTKLTREANATGRASTFGTALWDPSMTAVGPSWRLDNKQVGAYVICSLMHEYADGEITAYRRYTDSAEPAPTRTNSATDVLSTYREIINEGTTGGTTPTNYTAVNINANSPKPTVVVVIPWAAGVTSTDEAERESGYKFQDYVDALMTLPSLYDNVVVLNLWELTGNAMPDANGKNQWMINKGYSNSGILPNESGTGWMASELMKLFTK